MSIRNDLSLQAHYKTLYDTAEFTTTAVWKHEMATENIHDGSGAIVYSSMDTNFHAKELRYEGAGSASVTQFLTGIFFLGGGAGIRGLGLPFFLIGVNSKRK